MNKQVVSLLVDNHSGVLMRVTSLFGRRGFNIESLTVSTTNDPAISRITLVVQDDPAVLEQILLQTARLVETKQVFALNLANSLLRELLLVKVSATGENRTELREISSIFKAKTIDLSPDSMVFELTGEPDKIDGFLKMLEEFDVLEMCRTGVTALERGGKHDHIQQASCEDDDV